MLLETALLNCIWIFLRDPLAGAPRCVSFGAPKEQSALSQKFVFDEKKFNLTLANALQMGSGSNPPQGLETVFEADITIDKNFQAWAVRNVAFHLARARKIVFESKLFNPYFKEKKLSIHITPEKNSYGLMKTKEIFLGEAATLSSDFIYHEYGHHVIDWANPLIMKKRKVAEEDSDGYALIEAYANHFAFALDNEPTFGEYDQARKNGNPKYAYRVDTSCSLSSCDQAAFKAGRVYQVVILFGSVLWDLKQQVGSLESIYLMLDSLQFAKDGKLTIESAAENLKAADRLRNGGANIKLIENSMGRRFL